MGFDWDGAIEINRTALLRIVEGLMALVDLVDCTIPALLPRSLCTVALRVLRPAESAARRLIIIAARGLTVKARPARPLRQGVVIPRRASPRLAFQLFDPRKQFGRRRGRLTCPDSQAPRIHFFHPSPFVPLFQRPAPVPAAPEPPDDETGAVRLGRRIAALQAALGDLPAQARRLARWQARRNRMTGFIFREPLRPGLPPGYRRKPKNEAEQVLRECHTLAFSLLHPQPG